jgi:hypothetical protein
MPKLSSSLAFGFAVVVTGPRDAAATAFNAAKRWLVLGDTIIDSDMAFLAQTYGAFPDTLSFGVDASPSSYTASMSGTYGGSGLSISYAGNLSSYTPTVSWTGIGSYGTNTWSSNGTATFSFPTATLFQEVYASSSTVGTHSETTSVMISGTDGPVTYTGTSTVQSRMARTTAMSNCRFLSPRTCRRRSEIRPKTMASRARRSAMAPWGTSSQPRTRSRASLPSAAPPPRRLPIPAR